MRHFAFLAQGPNDGGERLCGLVGGLAIARATRGAMGDRSIPVPVKKVANHSRVRHPTDDRAAVFGSGTTLRTRSRTARPPADPGWPGPSLPVWAGPLRKWSGPPRSSSGVLPLDLSRATSACMVLVQVQVIWACADAGIGS